MFLWILVFTLSLVSDVSPSSSKVSYGNFISPRIRNSKCKVLSSGCCSPTLSCQRQLNLYPKFLHISHRENGSFEVLSLQATMDQEWAKELREIRRMVEFLVHRGRKLDVKTDVAATRLERLERESS